ncbi:hypothetical protein PP301_gp094 [Gordonia phage GMA2]|uniref:Uncharacterized protein n=1 Tax=Gordonia phage GMA2 TaxID=1647283 RepID=A0A0K0N799_9CAUD|nr:hypothetical protein PP301_gp094 [Gordonia phage GMA2]AKJ72628.1 hypothetical protein GMA2_90 [Gordonia phage GMA2]
MTIDPSKCANDEAYMVELQNGRTTVGIRLGQPHSTEAGAYPWLVPYWGSLVWCSDEQIKTLEPLKQRPDKSERDTTSAWKKIADHPLLAECYADESGSLIDAVLARLDYLASLETAVSEPEEKVLDVPMQPWDILRAVAEVVIADGFAPTMLTTVLDVADYLTGQAGRIEAEHRAAQEKAAADAAREALIVKAARIQCDAIHGPGAFDDREPDDHVRDRYVDSTRALADAGYLAEAVQP